MTAVAPPPLYLVPRMPERTAKQCSVPVCGQDGRLYPGGWLCDEHAPRPRGNGPKPLADLIRGGEAA